LNSQLLLDLPTLYDDKKYAQINALVMLGALTGCNLFMAYKLFTHFVHTYVHIHTHILFHC